MSLEGVQDDLRTLQGGAGGVEAASSPYYWAMGARWGDEVVKEPDYLVLAKAVSRKKEKPPKSDKKKEKK